MGHVRNYTIGDVFRATAHAGLQRPAADGLGAFGLPAENAAMANACRPQVDLRQHRLHEGAAADARLRASTGRAKSPPASRSTTAGTSGSSSLLEKGLFYRPTAPVNWDPVDQTVIANEQVRDAAPAGGHTGGVTTRSVPEWVLLGITAYADDLLVALTACRAGPNASSRSSATGLARRRGTRIKFPFVGRDGALEIFTTRLDTIFGCTYVALAPEHPRLPRLPRTSTKPRSGPSSRSSARSMHRAHRGGHDQGGSLHRSAREEPVHRRGGAGAARQLRARRLRHRRRDVRAGARSAGLRVRAGLWAPHQAGDLPGGRRRPRSASSAAYTEDGELRDSGSFSGQTSAAARAAMAVHAREQGFGEPTVSWHLRDWGFSRQRYWGTPIPVVYCPVTGA